MWYGDPDEKNALATLEGGDIMPLGSGIVLIGMGERSSWQAVSQLARSLFLQGAAERIIVAERWRPPVRACTWIRSLLFVVGMLRQRL